jgi:CheY-like chemotaxis protein
VDLSDLTRDMVSLIQTSIPRTVRLQLDLAAGLPPIIADLTQMQQIVMNLVINGAEAIGEGPGVVKVTTGIQYLDEHARGIATLPGEVTKPGRYVSLEVRDNGCGMDEATLGKIFDPFFTTKFTGRGLGLSATLGIARGHQGLIQVDSRPGEGCAFRVLIPAAEESVPAAPAPEPATEDLTGSGVVLVVDDEEVVRRAAAVALEHCGYAVITAVEGKAATDLFRRFSTQIVLVVLDLSMPVMNGEECLQRMKGIQPDGPVILSSGFSEADTVERFHVRGFAGFLQKPYTARRLAALAHAVLKQSGRKASQMSA